MRDLSKEIYDNEIYFKDALSQIDDGEQPKIATVNLFIDTNIIQEIRKEARQMETSLNFRINVILKKYFDFYKRAEEVADTCIITKKYFQFVVDSIDEKQHIIELTKTFRVWTPALFNDLNVQFTLDNFMKYICETYGRGVELLITLLITLIRAEFIV